MRGSTLNNSDPWPVNSYRIPWVPKFPESRSSALISVEKWIEKNVNTNIYYFIRGH